MFLYEFEWIVYTGAANSAPFLFVVSLFRQHCVGVSSLSWFWIVVERHTATYYLIDYESNTRPQIAVILISMHVVISFSVAAALLMGAAYDIVITLCIGAPLYAATQIYLTMMLYYLRKYNKRVITEISSDQFKGKRYSLATKYQLNENLRGLEILRRLVLSATLFNSFIGLFITIAYGFFDESSAIAQILFAFLDMLMGLYPIVVLFLALHTFKEWRVKFVDILFTMFGRKKVDKGTNRVVTFDAHTETNLYFDYYKGRW